MDFVYGGAAAILAITLTHPVDVVKSRLQLRGEAAAAAARPGAPPDAGVARWLVRVAREEGARALYRGLGAAWGLQFAVTATRFGTYGAFKSLASASSADAGRASAWARNFALAGVSGALGAVAGNPFFAVKTRQQVYAASSALATGTQHRPKPLVRELADVVRAEGVRGLFRDLDAFMPRVVVYGAAQLSTYDALRARLSGWRSPFEQQVLASVGAAGASVTAIQPFDFVVVRLNNQPVDPVTQRGAFYSGPLDCLAKCVRSEGVLCLFKGYRANVARFVPYTVLVLMFVERLREAGATLLRR